MNRTRNTEMPRAYAGIDLGNGRFVEITDSAVNIRGNGHHPRGNGSTPRPASQMIEIARGLQELKASAGEITRVALDQDAAAIDDTVIQVMVGHSAELIPGDPESAYYVLSLTYGLARRHATLWKHALVASLLGFLVLYDRQSPAEAIPIFQDLEVMSQILGNWLGCSDSARGLCELARRGLREAHSALTDPDPGTNAQTHASRVWSAIQEYSRASEASQFFMQSEAFARGMLLLGEQAEESVADELCQIGKDHLLAADPPDGSLPPTACFPVITLAEVLAERGFKTLALELLEHIKAACIDSSPLIQVVLANRTAAALYALGNPASAWRRLDSLPSEALATLAGHSVTAQGELLLYALNRAQLSCAEGDMAATGRWTKDAARQSHSIEQWNQVSSRTRQDDLRLLHYAILHNAAHERQEKIRRLV